MPIGKSAKKSLRKAISNTLRNQGIKKAFKKLVVAAKKKPGVETLKKAVSAIDKATKNNLLHRNKASRLKSQLAKMVKNGTPTVAKVKAKAKKVTSKRK